MDKNNLNVFQNLNSGRVFLNIFGLKLEDKKEIDKLFRLKIFDSKDEEVGLLYFKDGHINIDVNSNFGKIAASYDIAEISKKGHDNFLLEWQNKVNFTVVSNNKINFKGNIVFECSVDSEFEVHCITNSSIEFNKYPKKIIMEFMKNGHEFRYKEISDEYFEQLEVNCYDFVNGFIKHQIRKGRYDREKLGYPYIQFYGILPVNSDKEKIRVHAFSQGYLEILFYMQQEVLSEFELDSKASIIQKGLLMKKLDPDFFKKIEEIRNLFINDDVSLLDNFIDISFYNYTDEQIKSLFGFDIQRIKYQNGATNLVNAYYGIEKNNIFLLEELEETKGKKI